MKKVILTILLMTVAETASAGLWEYSLGFSFNRNRYGEGSFQWRRRWGTSLGFQFDNHSGIELSYQDVVVKTRIVGFQDTKFHDRVISANWVFNLTSRQSKFRPYSKLGIGQLIRDATGTYSNGSVPLPGIDELSGVVALGVKIFLVSRVALRIEASTYLEGARISTWEDNLYSEVGISVYF